MKKSIILICLSLGLISLTYAQTLQDYFEVAAENNPGLQSKFKNFEASLQRVDQVSSLPDANLSFGYFISPVETRVGPQQARFSLTQMFPWFGTLRSQENAASLMAEANYQEFLDARNRLFYQVASAYYPLIELQRLITIEEENLSILTSYKNIATVKYQNSKGTMVDVLRVDIMLKDASTNLSILKQKQRPLETRFNRLLNRDDTEAILINDASVTKGLETDYRRDSILTSNPILDALDLRIRASEAREEVAVKQGLPKIGLGLDYVIVGERSDATVADNGKDAIMPMVTLSLPLFRGKYKAAQKEAQLNQESIGLQREEQVNKLFSLYDLARFEIQKQTELMQLYNDQILESDQSINLIFSAYSNTGEDFEEVLRMQQQILKYQKMKAKALTEYHTAIAELDYLTAKTY